MLRHCYKQGYSKKNGEYVKGFSTRKRMVFILKNYYHYSYEEISSILNCPIGTVRSRLHYCIKKLRSLI